MSLEKNWPIFLLVWAGVLIGFFYLVLIPGGERLERLKEEKRNMEDQVIVLERKVRNSEGLEKKLTELTWLLHFLRKGYRRKRKFPTSFGD